MLYAIISTDTKNSLEKRMSVRPKHVERLNQLKSEGRLVVAGPNPAIDNSDPGEAGYTGSLIIAEFNSLKEAKDWAKNDPYIESGAYKNVVVKPFKKVLP